MVFDIPVNFAEEGTVFGGKVKSRNVLETILFLVLLLIPIFSLPVSMKTKMYLAVLFVLPLCIFSVIGILGESLMAFVMAVLYYLKNRKVWAAPDEAYRTEMEQRERRRRKAEEKKEELVRGILAKKLKRGGEKSGTEVPKEKEQSA